MPVVSYPGQEVHQGERHGEGTEEKVRYSEVGNEDVPRSQHDLVGEKSEKDGGVANDAKYDDQTVEDNESIVNHRIQSIKRTLGGNSETQKHGMRLSVNLNSTAI